MYLPLIITNNCNFHCLHCIRGYARGENISLDLVKKILPQAKNAGYKGVSFTGGEPILHPSFQALVEVAVNNKMEFQFISNGWYWEKYKFILKNKKFVGPLLFSLDGATKNVHDKIRQKGSYDRVIKAIRYFKAEGVSTGISVCFNQYNKHQTGQFIALAHKYNLDTIGFTVIIKTSFNKYLLLSENERMVIFSDLNNRLTSSKIKCVINYASFPIRHGLHFCLPMSRKSTFSINFKGEGIFCCNTTGAGQSLGSLYENSFTKVYSNYIKMYDYIMLVRKSLLRNKKSFKCFDSCEYCNAILSGNH
jgi:MoaA/NifB/PqqE/SkfB family radical SAM enzyme